MSSEPTTRAGRALLADLREQHVVTVDDPRRIAAIEAEVRADLEAKVRGLRPADDHDPNYVVPLAAVLRLLTDGAEPQKGTTK